MFEDYETTPRSENIRERHRSVDSTREQAILDGKFIQFCCCLPCGIYTSVVLFLLFDSASLYLAFDTSNQRPGFSAGS